MQGLQIETEKPSMWYQCSDLTDMLYPSAQADGRVAWRENSEGVEDRNSLAKAWPPSTTGVCGK